MRKKYPRKSRSNGSHSYQTLEPRQLLAAMPLITEFLASNGSGLIDDNGNRSDWIELYNAGNTGIDLAGYTLTDDPTTPDKWTFPNHYLAAGQFKVVFAANDDAPGAGVALYTGFGLSAAGEYLALFDPAGNVVSEYAAGGNNYPEQQQDISYGVRFDTGNFDQVSYFLTPTPGALNTSPVAGVVGRVQSSVSAGFYESSFQVSLTTNTAGATIRYTTNGSTPTATNGTLYSGPITISSTTNLRAVASRSGYLSVTDRTWSYIFIDDVLQQSNNGSTPPGWPSSWGSNTVDYGMDPDVIAREGAQQVKDALLAIPTWSITTDLDNLFSSSTGIYANAGQDGAQWERPASVELLQPDGSAGFQVNAGLRIRGGFSRSNSNPKHSFRLFFRSEYGDANLQYPLHPGGTDTFEKIDLRTAQNYSWSFGGDSSNDFIADVLAREAQLALGQPTTRSAWLHLYINGQYWGLYQTQERAEANFAASYFGGNADDYDVIKPEAGPYQNSATDGNLSAYNQLFAQAKARASDGITPNFVNDAAVLKAQGLNPDGSRNPTYKVLLDVDNLIAYMTVIFHGGNLDAPISNFLGNNRINNYIAIRDRTGDEGFRFFIHDSEHTLRNLNENRTGPYNHSNFESSVNYFNPQWLHQQLMANVEYRLRFADSIYKNFFNGGPMSVEAQTARLDAQAAAIDMAIIAESARWGDAKRTQPLLRSNWLNAVNNLRQSYIPNRTGVFLNQLRGTVMRLKDSNGNYNVVRDAALYPASDAPEFLINGNLNSGGLVTAGSQLRMATNVSTVYYTLDGSDPRLPGGGINPSALSYVNSTVDTKIFASGADWKYLDTGANLGTAWQAAQYNDAAWSVGASQLGYGDGDESTTVSFGSNSSSKHITTYFRKTFNVAAGSYAGATVRLKRDDGAVVYLNGVEIIRDNLPAGTIQFNTTASGVTEDDTFYEFEIDPGLLLAGANTLAVEIHQVSGGSSDISFDAELIVTSDAGGSSPITLNTPTAIRARARSTAGEWSAIHDTAFYFEAASQSNIRISEINYHPYDLTPDEIAAGFADADLFEFIEIMNSHSGGTIDLNGMQLADGVTFTFGNESLAPGERAVVVEDVAAFQARYGTGVRILGSWSGALSNGGELLTLLDSSATEVMSVTYDDVAPWYEAADGAGSTLELINPSGTPVSDLGLPQAWRASAEHGGTPGAASDAAFIPQVANTIRDNGSLARPDLWSTYSVAFNQNVNVSANSLVLLNATSGDSLVNLAGMGFNYNDTTFTATWTLNTLTTPLVAAFYTAQLNAATITSVSDGLALDGDADGSAGGNFQQSVYKAIPGDANLDGDVDIFQLANINGQFQNVGDLAIVKSNLGSFVNVGWNSGDFNGDSDVDVFDFRLGLGNVGDLAVLYANLGRNVRPPAGAPAARLVATVAEPETDLDRGSTTQETSDSNFVSVSQPTSTFDDQVVPSTATSAPQVILITSPEDSAARSIVTTDRRETIEISNSIDHEETLSSLSGSIDIAPQTPAPELRSVSSTDEQTTNVPSQLLDQVFATLLEW